LVDPVSPVSEPLTTSNTLTSTLISTEQSQSKSIEIIPMTSTNNTKEMGKKSSKDDKEPIQIVRGGRVITLPPIEAPATRSKRLQAKTETPQKSSESIKKVEKIT
jgi:hypothetical protein